MWNCLWIIPDCSLMYLADKVLQLSAHQHMVLVQYLPLIIVCSLSTESYQLWLYIISSLRVSVCHGFSVWCHSIEPILKVVTYSYVHILSESGWWLEHAKKTRMWPDPIGDGIILCSFALLLPTYTGLTKVKHFLLKWWVIFSRIYHT